MSFTRSTTNTSVHQGMPDYPSAEGYSTTQLKQAFDAPAEGLQSDINRLATELEDTTGAANIGADAIVSGDDSGANIQAKLEKLYTDMQGISQGAIPDGTITEAKMDATYEGTLAKKDGTLQTGLSAEMLNGKTEAQLKTAFLSTPNPTTLSFTKLDPPSSGSEVAATETETKTVQTNGGRYYLMLSTYSDCTLLLYDAQTNKIVVGTYIGRYVDNAHSTFSFNVSQIRLHTGDYSRAWVEMTTSYSNKVLTININKRSWRQSSSSQTTAPAGSLTIFELGGIV